MAAPSGIVWGSVVGSKGKLGIYTKLTKTNTQTQVNVQVWIATSYNCYDSSNDFYFDIGTSVSSASTNRGDVSFNHTSGTSWSDSNQTKIWDKTYTYSRAKTATAYKIYAKLSGVDWVGGTMSVNTSVTVPVLPSYTVTFNANGGSGGEGVMTKWHGESLTIPSAVPTRTGYTFQGWGLSSTTTTVSYKAGGSYTTNASDTLYAVWKANTYTVTFNANGGSGGPGKQTKTHGVSLKLSTTKPTRANYNFLGWGTSTSDTSVDYAPGANYTSNASITLYAIWQLAYKKPRITGFTVTRCNSEGTADSAGLYAKVVFNWATDKAAPTVKIEYLKVGTTTWTSASSKTASGTNGAVSEVIGGALSAEYTYSVRATVTDSGGALSISATLPSEKFLIDFRANGNGVGIGAVASKNNALMLGYTAYDKFGTLMGNGLAAYNGADNQIDPNTTIEPLILTNHANGPSTNFHYIHTVFYNTKSATTERAQIAIPYNSSRSIYIRRYYTEWSDWLGMINEDNISSYFDNAAITFTPDATNARSSTSAVRYKSFMKTCFCRIYVVNNVALTAGSTYTMGSIPSNYAPGTNAALSYHGTKQGSAAINTSGQIRFTPWENMNAGFNMNFAGFWFKE